jgi:serine/threonine-protein kinase
MALARQHRYAEALADAEAALRVDPKNQVGMNTRAAALNKLKRFADAAAQARAAIEANPNDANAYRNLAEALAGLGDRGGSLAALRRAAELDARFQPTLEQALQLPGDADLNLLFADDAPAGAAVAAARGSGAGVKRKWDFGFIAAAAAVGAGLLVVGLIPLFSRQISDLFRKFTRHQVVRASEVQFVEALIKGQFRLGGELAAGGSGTVYEGFDIQLLRPVAIKRLSDAIKADPQARARFVQEVKRVAALHHHNISGVLAISDDGDDVFLVSEFVKGKTLQELTAARGPLPLAEALPILRAATDALEHAHGRGILHRDLKPTNIMVGEDGTVKVLDFGLAPTDKPYQAPEQEKGLARKESDVYSLALCAYELLTGRAAFAGTDAGMLLNKLDKSFAPASTLAPELPAGADQIFSAALEPDPGKRLGSAKEFLARLEALSSGARR